MKTVDEQERSYVAFISYRHNPLDREAAVQIQKKIENYIVPGEYREKAGGKKLGLCFRDEDELPASSSLTDSIYYALDHTRFLIVICTPDLPRSKWCEAEIRYFLKTHDRDHILAVLADGDPSESFSPYMLHTYDEEGNIVSDTEPLAANIAGGNHTIDKKALKKEVVRLFAALIGCPFDSLWQRERRARTNRLLAAGAAAFAVMAVFLGVVLNRNAKIEMQNAQIVEQNGKITSQYDRILEQNEKIEEQNSELSRQLSSALVESGRNKLDNYDLDGALSDALKAVSGTDPDLYDDGAANLFAETLGAYTYNESQSRLIYEQNIDLVEIVCTDDKSHAVLLDKAGVVRCLDLDSNKILWQTGVEGQNAFLYTEHQGSRVLIKTENRICCCNLNDGSQIWSYEYTENCGNGFQCISQNGKWFAVLDKKEYGANDVCVRVLDTGSGEIRSEIRFGGENYEWNLYSMDQKAKTAAAFSKDGSKLAVLLPGRAEEGNGYSSLLFAADLKTGEQWPVCVFAGTQLCYGVRIDDRGDQLFAAVLNTAAGGIETVRCVRNGEAYDLSTSVAVHAVSMTAGNDLSFGSYTDHKPFGMISNDLYSVIISDNFFFIYRPKESAELCRSWALTGKIISVRWQDEEKNVFETISEDGWYIDYTLAALEEDGLIESLSGTKIDVENQGLAVPLHGSLVQDREEGSALTADKKSLGRLLMTAFRSDPNGQDINLQKEDLEHVNGIWYDPASDEGMLFYNSNSVLTFDRKNGKILAQMDTGENLDYQKILIPDAGAFLKFGYKGAKKYSLQDKTFLDYGAPISINDKNITIVPNQGTLLSDGRIFMTGSETYYDYYGTGELFQYYGCWLDEEPIAGENDRPAVLIVLNKSYADLPVPLLGKNELMMLYGLILDDPDALVTYPVPGSAKKIIAPMPETPEFGFLDAKTGEIWRMENPYPDSGEFSAAMANEAHVLALSYKDGKICLLEPDTKTVREIGAEYSTNEPRKLCFSDDDRYLLVVTSAAKLDVYDTETFECVFSREIEAFSKGIQAYSSLYDLEETTVASKNKMLVTISSRFSGEGYSAVLDRNTWTVDAQITGEYTAYVPNENRIYVSDKSRISSFPVYGLGDFKTWAEEIQKEQ